MEKGWIKLHRKILKSALWKDCNMAQKVVLITLLIMANHENNEWIFNGEKYKCKPGQFVTSLKSIQEKAGQDISIMQIRTSLLKFENYGFLTRVATKRSSLITIENWRLYQSDIENITNNQQSNQHSDEHSNQHSEQQNNQQSEDMAEYVANTRFKGNKKDKITQQITQQVTQSLTHELTQSLTTNKKIRNKELNNSIKDTMLCPSPNEDGQENVEKVNMKSQIDQVIAAWNNIDGIQKIIKVSKGTQRYNLLTARINEYGLDKVLECVHGVEHSSFLKGYTSQNGWKADFDWIVKPANFIKILEGKYVDKQSLNDKTSNQNITPVSDKSLKKRDVSNMTQEEIDEFIFD